jgi:hypothetical protein
MFRNHLLKIQTRFFRKRNNHNTFFKEHTEIAGIKISMELFKGQTHPWFSGGGHRVSVISFREFFKFVIPVCS